MRGPLWRPPDSLGRPQCLAAITAAYLLGHAATAVVAAMNAESLAAVAEIEHTDIPEVIPELASHGCGTPGQPCPLEEGVRLAHLLGDERHRVLYLSGESITIEKSIELRGVYLHGNSPGTTILCKEPNFPGIIIDAGSYRSNRMTSHVTGLTVKGCQIGILVRGRGAVGQFIAVQNVTLRDSSRVGLGVHGEALQLELGNVSMIRNRHSGLAIRGRNVAVVSVKSYTNHNGQAGVFIQGRQVTLETVLSSSSGNFDSGVLVRGSRHLLVARESRFENNGKDGIVIFAANSSLHMEGSAAVGNKGCGLRSTGGSADVVVSASNFSTNTQQGLLVLSSDTGNVLLRGVNIFGNRITSYLQARQIDVNDVDVTVPADGTAGSWPYPLALPREEAPQVEVPQRERSEQPALDVGWLQDSTRCCKLDFASFVVWICCMVTTISILLNRGSVPVQTAQLEERSPSDEPMEVWPSPVAKVRERDGKLNSNALCDGIVQSVLAPEVAAPEAAARRRRRPRRRRRRNSGEDEAQECIICFEVCHDEAQEVDSDAEKRFMHTRCCSQLICSACYEDTIQLAMPCPTCRTPDYKVMPMIKQGAVQPKPRRPSPRLEEAGDRLLQGFRP